MDAPANFPAPKDPPGHTRQLSVRDDGRGGVLIALECSCQRVFASGRFAVNDQRNVQAIMEEGQEKARRRPGEGQEKARQHVDEVWEDLHASGAYL